MEPDETSTITILVAEALSLVRAGLRALLAEEPGFVVIGETGDGREVVSLVARLKPDVLIVAPDLPGPPAGKLVADALATHPNLAVVVVLGQHHTDAVQALLASGAHGCFLNSDRPGEFLRGIRAAATGESALSTSVARLLLGHLNESQRRQRSEDLTEREREILALLTAGLSNKEIAQRLYLSVRTVEVHLRNVYAKLGVRSRLEAVTRRAQQGFRAE